MMQISVKAHFLIRRLKFVRHENRKCRRRGGVAIFVHEPLCYTKENGFYINWNLQREQKIKENTKKKLKQEKIILKT